MQAFVGGKLWPQHAKRERCQPPYLLHKPEYNPVGQPRLARRFPVGRTFVRARPSSTFTTVAAAHWLTEATTVDGANGGGASLLLSSLSTAQWRTQPVDSRIQTSWTVERTSEPAFAADEAEGTAVHRDSQRHTATNVCAPSAEAGSGDGRFAEPSEATTFPPRTVEEAIDRSRRFDALERDTLSDGELNSLEAQREEREDARPALFEDGEEANGDDDEEEEFRSEIPKLVVTKISAADVGRDRLDLLWARRRAPAPNSVSPSRMLRTSPNAVDRQASGTASGKAGDDREDTTPTRTVLPADRSVSGAEPGRSHSHLSGRPQRSGQPNLLMALLSTSELRTERKQRRPRWWTTRWFSVGVLIAGLALIWLAMFSVALRAVLAVSLAVCAVAALRLRRQRDCTTS